MGLFRKKDDAFANKVIKVLSTNDEAKFHQALLELGTIVQNKDSIYENRKLDIYDIISRLQNSINDKDRQKYIQKLAKKIR